VQISEELVRPGFRKSSSFSSTSRPAPGKNPMLQFPVVLHLITSPYFRPTTVTPQLIADLAGYLTATTGAPPSGSQQVGDNENRLGDVTPSFSSLFIHTSLTHDPHLPPPHGLHIIASYTLPYT
jgi:hypothetical protein